MFIDITSISTTSMEDIPQKDGSVVVFNTGLACINPAVKGDSGCGILTITILKTAI